MTTPLTTNVLALPLATMEVITGSNEDWVDSIKYLVSPDGTDIIDVNVLPQLDLRGINFAMEVRREAPDHEVILSASIIEGTLAIGNPPDYGFLLINIPVTEMKLKQPGNYVGDIVANDDLHSRVAIQFTLQIVEGITR
jgi:hypothetical protein